MDKLKASLLIFLSPLCAQAAIAPPQPATGVLTREIQTRKSIAFDDLLDRWEKRDGTAAVKPLLQILSNRKLSDPDRYVALMGTAKLGGRSVAPLLVPFLKDPSWMIRSGTLQALSILRQPATAEATLPLLHDPALVVRLQAIDSIEKLNPKGATEALLSVLDKNENYHQGKALWVPQRALSALAKLGDERITPRLAFLLNHKSDPALQQQTIRTLEKLSGKPPATLNKHTLAMNVKKWKASFNHK
jgi:HEAT repeat protein